MRRVLTTRWIGPDVTLATRPWRASPNIADHGLEIGQALATSPAGSVVFILLTAYHYNPNRVIYSYILLTF